MIPCESCPPLFCHMRALTWHPQRMQFFAPKMHFLNAGPFSTEVCSLLCCIKTNSVSLEELNGELLPVLFHKAVKHKLKVQ